MAEPPEKGIYDRNITGIGMAISHKSPDPSIYEQTKCIKKNNSKTPNVMKLAGIFHISCFKIWQIVATSKVSMFVTIDDRMCLVKLAGALQEFKNQQYPYT